MENQQTPWFEGSVLAAVTKATTEKLLFLSFIYGIYNYLFLNINK